MTDPEAGLQHERTQLAWARTLLSATVTSLLLARLSLDAGTAERIAAGWSCAATVTLAVAARQRVTALRLATTEAAAPSMLRAVSRALLGLAAVELALALG